MLFLTPKDIILNCVAVILTVSRVTVKRYLPAYLTPIRAQHDNFKRNVQQTLKTLRLISIVS